MAKGRVSVKEDNLTLTLNNGTQSHRSVSGIKKLYYLSAGVEIYGNDSLSFLIEFEDELWLVPESTFGSDDLLVLFEILGPDIAFDAGIEYLPYSWRSVLFIFPGIEANLRILKHSELNKIKNKLSVKRKIISNSEGVDDGR